MTSPTSRRRSSSPRPPSRPPRPNPGAERWRLRSCTTSTTSPAPRRRPPRSTGTIRPSSARSRRWPTRPSSSATSPAPGPTTTSSGSLAKGAAVDVRLARLAFVTGGTDQALALATQARDEATTDVAAGGSTDLGFYDYAVGEYARTAGDATTAKAGYQAALAVRSTDLGRSRRARPHRRVRRRYDGGDRGAPEGRGDRPPARDGRACSATCLAATGDATGAAKQFATVGFIEKLGEIQSTVYDRVILRFELDHGGATDALLAQARASLAARARLHRLRHGRVGALPPRTLRRGGRRDHVGAANGAADARLHLPPRGHRGRAGHADAGRADLQRALALGPALDPNERAEAEHSRSVARD